MKTLFVFNNAAHGSEHLYNSLRWANTMAKQAEHQVRVFLFGETILCTKTGIKLPEGFPNLQSLLENIKTLHPSNAIGLCSSCMNARGVEDGDLIPGAHRSSLNELCEWTAWADKVLVI